LFIHNKIKCLLVAFLMLMTNFTVAQDLATAKQLWADNRVVAAKEAIDSYLADTGSEDAEGWLLKAAIYAAISKDPQLKYLVADGRSDAFQAIKKATAINANLVANNLQRSDFDMLKHIYQGYAADGVAFFNAGSEKKSTEDYAAALENFKKARIIGQFTQEQGWKLVFQPNDSILLYNTAQAAINAQKEDEAVLYSKKLADMGIAAAGSYTKADFENIYQWLVNYYNINKDSRNLQFYAAAGAKVYPQNQYFANISINNYRETGNNTQMVQAYEAALKRFPGNHALIYCFCTDLFTYIYAPGTSVKTKRLLYPKLESNLQAYSKTQPDSAKAYLLLGKHFYNKAVDLQKAGAGNKPVVTAFNQAIKMLKIFTNRPFEPGSKIRIEAFEIMITAYKAAGRKGEADAAFTEMMGL
jgi:hypothetical protein